MRRCACSTSPPWTVWSRRRSPSRMRRASCRASWRRARTVLPQSSVIHSPERPPGERHVRRRGARPHHDRPQPARPLLRAGAAHAWRHLRGGRGFLPRDPHRAKRGGGHRGGARRAEQGAEAAGLPEPRRAAAIQGPAHDHGVSLPPRVRRHGRGGQGRGARRGRQGPRQDPGHAARDGPRPRLLRRAGMIDVAFAIPGDIELRTGGYTYDRRVMALLQQFGVRPAHLTLAGGYPSPTDDDLRATAEAFAKVPREAVLMVDGLAYGAMPTEVIARATCPIVALVHHPLCLETGLSAGRQAELKASETAALRLARHVIVTSGTTAAHLSADFRVAAEKITVAEPGTDPAPRAAAGPQSGTNPPSPVRLLAVGSVVPRKGYDVLVCALVQLSHLEWELVIAGDRDRSPETTRGLEAQIGSCKLSGRVRLAGSLDERALEIGRASCRERVERWGGGGAA